MTPQGCDPPLGQVVQEKAALVSVTAEARLASQGQQVKGEPGTTRALPRAGSALQGHGASMPEREGDNGNDRSRIRSQQH